MSGFMDMARMAKQAMEAKKMQKAIERKTFEYANAGVKVVVNGLGGLVGLEIDPELMAPKGAEKLQRLIVENVNKGASIAQNDMQQEMMRQMKEGKLDGILGGLKG